MTKDDEFKVTTSHSMKITEFINKKFKLEINKLILTLIKKINLIKHTEIFIIT